MIPRQYNGMKWVLLFCLFIISCSAAGKKDYDIGMKYNSAGEYKEAITYLKQAIEKEPDNEAYRQAMMSIIDYQVDKFVSEGEQALNSQTPVSLGTIHRATGKLKLAQEIAPDHYSVKSLENKINEQQQVLVSDIRRLYNETLDYMAKEDWIGAYFSLQQIYSRYPNYEDSSRLYAKVTQEGSQSFFNQAKERYDQEDFKGAGEYLRKSLSLQSDNRQAIEMLEIAQQFDNASYFIGQAREAVTAQNWDRALFAYEKALTYDPESKELHELIAYVRKKAGEADIRKANGFMTTGWLLKAFEFYDKAVENIEDRNHFDLKRLRRDLTLRAADAAEKFKEKKRFGAAWFWYEKIKKADPQFDKIFFLIQEMEDHIKKRVQKSIAVFDFSSPSDNKDAGVIVANNLITYLFNNAGGDIKILERENLKSKLEEMKLGQSGVVTASSAKEMGRVYGIDVAIMGSVLLYKVDTTVSNGTKSVRYQVGSKIEDNIDYLNWKAKHPHPDSLELKNAPPAKVKIPVFAEKDYRVSNHKKVGFIQLSFRIVDVRTGENIQVRTIESKKMVSDDTSAGLPEAKVKFDDLEIETDTELLQQMSTEVVSELGREVLRPLSSLERIYFQTGEDMLRRRDRLQAVENFTDAIFDEKMKQITDLPLTKQAQEKLIEIFRNYKITMGG